jgi:hypothetical protein
LLVPDDDLFIDPLQNLLEHGLGGGIVLLHDDEDVLGLGRRLGWRGRSCTKKSEPS